VHSGKDSLKVSKSEYMRMQEYVANNEPERALALFNELNKKNKKDIEASPIFKAQQEQMTEAVKTGDYKTAMNVAMNRTEDDFPTPSVESKSNDNGDSASRIERKKEIKEEQNRPLISAEEKAKQLAINEEDDDIKHFGQVKVNGAWVAAGSGKNMGEKLMKLEQSGQAQNQAPIVLKGGDTVNNVVTNNNTSSGGSGGGAGSPSRIGSPFDRFTIGNLWTPSP
jgi:hypothetical protein